MRTRNGWYSFGFLFGSGRSSSSRIFPKLATVGEGAWYHKVPQADAKLIIRHLFSQLGALIFSERLKTLGTRHHERQERTLNG